jgi:hypothetical protein
MFTMFNKPPHDTATRTRFLGLSRETKPLPNDEYELFKNIDAALKQCGGGLADEVEVTFLERPEKGKITETDAYTISRPGPGQRS